MFKFPKDLYCDVRIEDVYETKITYTLGELEESKIRNYKGAFVRIFDGNRWYYCSSSNLDNLQVEIDELSKLANPNPNIYENPIVKKLEVNKEKELNYNENSADQISIKDKKDILKDNFKLLDDNKYITNWKSRYIDKRIVKEIYSSKGTNLKFDTQTFGMTFDFNLSKEDKRFSDSYRYSSDKFKALKNHTEKMDAHIKKCEDVLLNSVPVEAGKYTVVLSPLAAGVFAHESFGHKSEADLMVGDETMVKEWSIGKKVGSDILSIVDDGNPIGSGYTPYDDEGSKGRKTYLVKNGLLNGRLHSTSTGALLDEEITGNSRAMNFEYEPIVRMTTTYIEGGDKTKEELIGEVKDGLFIETIKHGSGMSTFTLAPSIAYKIKDGKITEPVNISVITGNVMETLNEIDGLSNEVELMSFVTGGCGKMEQYPLPVGFGGPYVRVKNINVQ